MSKPHNLTVSQAQRLEAWMQEVTSLICYQPEVPLEHKKVLVEAMTEFNKELGVSDPATDTNRPS